MEKLLDYFFVILWGVLGVMFGILGEVLAPLLIACILFGMLTEQQDKRAKSLRDRIIKEQGKLIDSLRMARS